MQIDSLTCYAQKEKCCVIFFYWNLLRPFDLCPVAIMITRCDRKAAEDSNKKDRITHGFSHPSARNTFHAQNNIKNKIKKKRSDKTDLYIIII